MTVKFDTIVPKPVITMINTMMFLTVQVSGEGRKEGGEREEGGREGRGEREGGRRGGGDYNIPIY